MGIPYVEVLLYGGIPIWEVPYVKSPLYTDTPSQRVSYLRDPLYKSITATIVVCIFVSGGILFLRSPLSRFGDSRRVIHCLFLVGELQCCSLATTGKTARCKGGRKKTRRIQ